MIMKLTKCELTAVQSARKTELETIIKNGVQSFREVGEALAEVKASGLYRDEYGTFEDYCRDKWNLSRSRGYQLIEAANIARNVSKILDIPTDTAAREFVKASPKDQKKAARAIAKSGKRATAKNVKAAVEKVTPKREPKWESKHETHEEPARQRGGLAAVVRESRAAEKASTNGHAPEPMTDAELLGKYPLLTAQVCAQAARLIEAWYMRERQQLNYPLATPERVKSLIVKLLASI